MHKELDEMIRIDYEQAMEEEIRENELRRLAMTVPNLPEEQ